MNYYNKKLSYRVAFEDANTPVLVKYGVRKQDGGATYYLDRERTVKLIFCKGEKRASYFKSEAGYREQIIKILKNSESVEHYESKVELLANKSITIDGIEYKAHSAEMEVEFMETGNIIDVVLFDENGDIIMGVELVESNKKSIEDIKKLQKLNINIYEKKTNNSSSTIEDKFICFESSTEAIRESISNTEKQIRDVKTECNHAEYNIERNGDILTYSSNGKVGALCRQIRDNEQQIRNIKKEEQGLGATVEDRIQQKVSNTESEINRLKAEIEASEREIRELEPKSVHDRSIRDDVRSFEEGIKELEEEHRILKERSDESSAITGEIKRLEERLQGRRIETKRINSKSKDGFKGVRGIGEIRKEQLDLSNAVETVEREIEEGAIEIERAKRVKLEKDTIKERFERCTREIDEIESHKHNPKETSRIKKEIQESKGITGEYEEEIRKYEIKIRELW